MSGGHRGVASTNQHARLPLSFIKYNNELYDFCLKINGKEETTTQVRIHTRHWIRTDEWTEHIIIDHVGRWFESSAFGTAFCRRRRRCRWCQRARLIAIRTVFSCDPYSKGPCVLYSQFLCGYTNGVIYYSDIITSAWMMTSSSVTNPLGSIRPLLAGYPFQGMMYPSKTIHVAYFYTDKLRCSIKEECRTNDVLIFL